MSKADDKAARAAPQRDNGTAELSQRKTVIPRLKGGSGYNYNLHVVDGDEIDRLLLVGLIDVPGHSTLNSFKVMLHRSKMLGPATPSFEKRGTSAPGHISQQVAEALAGVQRVMMMLKKKRGGDAANLIMNICLDAPHKEVSKATLAMVLEALRQAMDY